MRRPGVQLSLEVLVEESRFILRTLLRDDLFGKRVRLTEAERVLDSSISLTFADYCGFLNKFGYVRIDQLANVIEVTEGGAAIAQSGDDPEFQARLSRHFARELGTTQVKRPVPPVPSAPAAEPTMTVRPRSIAPEAPAPVAAPGEEIIDRRYRRGTTLGAGPIGQVFEGEHIGLGRPVVIKEARAIFQFVSYLKRDEIVRRLKSAVQAQASLIHPGIAQVLDQNHEREFPYFVLEHAGGGNLRRRMAAAGDGRMSVTLAVRVLLQVLYALRHAHQRGVPHLGLKPENVLFDSLGNVKLTDFGLARAMDRDDEATTSQIPVLVGSGTVGYFAPERLQPAASQPAGPQADIYSVGILCYEMLTGKLPGRRSPLPSQARKDVPAAFDDVFDKMTRDDLSERYRNVDEVLAGVYKAFGQKEVFTEGTILLWAADPAPPPDIDEAPEPEEVVVAEQASAPAVVRADAAADPIHLSAHDLVPSEVPTGEIDTSGVVSEVRRSRPPPPPPGPRGK
jgi:serine/threonine protein kinase